MSAIRILVFGFGLAIGSTIASTLFASVSLANGVDIVASKFFAMGGILVQSAVCFIGYFLLAKLSSYKPYLQMLLVYLLANCLLILALFYILGRGVFQVLSLFEFLWSLVIAIIATNLGVAGHRTGESLQPNQRLHQTGER